MINKTLKSYLKKYPGKNFTFLALVIVENLIWLVNTFFNINLTNDAIAQDKRAFLTTLVYSLVSMLALVIVKRFTSLSGYKLSQNVINDIRNDSAFAIINATGVSDFSSSGSYVSQLSTDTSYIRNNGVGAYIQIVRAAVSIIFSLVGAALVHWSYILIFPLTMALSMITPKLLSPKIEKTSAFYSNSRETFLSFLTDILNGFGIFKRNNLEKDFKEKIGDISEKFEADIYEYYVHMSLYESFISFASIFSQFIYVLASLVLVYLGYISVGAIVGLFNFSQTIYGGVSSLLNGFGTINSVNPIFEKLFPIFADKSGEKLEDINNIDFENISISYGDHDVIKDLSFSIVKGEKVAITGKSGSGKTTIIKSILKELEPKSGAILLNGVNIEDVDYRSIYDNIGVISQDPYLFNTSIIENVTLGLKNPPMDKMEHLIDKLDLRAFINSQSDGIETVLSNNGQNISGGQRQRLVILRELLRDKNMLVLDEGTSSLDKETKDSIEDFLLETDLTVIYITHPRSDDELKEFDKIINLA